MCVYVCTRGRYLTWWLVSCELSGLNYFMSFDLGDMLTNAYLVETLLAIFSILLSCSHGKLMVQLIGVVRLFEVVQSVSNYPSLCFLS
jgi:Na+/pantothenate symporter